MPPLTLSLSAQEHSLSQSRSQYIKAKVNTSHHKKKAVEVRDALRKSQKLMAIKEQELAEERQEIVELERTWKIYERQLQEKRASCRTDIELNEDQVSVCQTMPPSFLFRRSRCQRTRNNAAAGRF